MISAEPLPARSFSARRPPAGLRALILLCCSSLGAGLGCSEALEDPLGGGGDADFGSIYSSAAFQECSGCHAPDAPGRTQGTEATQDWSTEASARRTLRGSASGLIGNFEGCNGVPLLGSSSSQSLLVAALDFDVRQNFELSAFPDCTGDAIADQTNNIMASLSDGLLQDLKDWIDAGAP